MRFLISILLTFSLLPSLVLAQTPQKPLTTTRPIVQSPEKPLSSILLRDDGLFFIDFGADAFASLELNFPNIDILPPNHKITLRLGEKLASPNHLDPKPTGSIRFLQTSITLQPGQKTYRPPLAKDDARMMPPHIGPVMPFRYVEIENFPPNLNPKDFLIRNVAHYPFDDSAADFSSSDETLNAVWKLSKHTLKATSFCGLFVDGDRERKPYEADAYINQLGWYYATTDASLPAYTHEYLMTHPTWPTEWILFSVQTAWLDYLYTGDKKLLAAWYKDLHAKTLLSLAREDSLISTSSVPRAVKQAIHFNGNLKDIVDWPESERDNYDMRPINTVVNAFHCRALFLMSQIAQALDKPDDVLAYKKAYDLALASLNSKLFDPATGLYIDGEGSAHSSQHANFFPLAFNLVPEERKPKVIEFILSKGMAPSVYGAQFLLDALYSNGLADQATALITAPTDRSWKHMLDLGATMTLEAWDAKYKPNLDWNHAWGAAPANLLPRYLLGVQPLSPGYAQTLIQPQVPKSLAFAKGTVPTVKGKISVEWKQTENSFTLSTFIPQNTTALIILPKHLGQSISHNNSPVNPSQPLVAFHGLHTFSITP